MPYAAAVGGAMALAGGVMQGNRAASEAKKGRALQRESLDFAKGQYADYKEMYGGMEADMISEIESYVPGEKLQTYMGESTADVAMAFDKRRGQTSREMGRYGIDPSQSRFDERQDEIGREKALAEVSGRTGARRKSEADDDKNFARRLAAISTGKEIPGQAGAVMGALQSGADAYSADASRSRQGASASYGMAGQLVARGVDAYNATPDTGVGGDYSGGGYVAPGGSFGMDAGYGDADVDY